MTTAVRTVICLFLLTLCLSKSTTKTIYGKAITQNENTPEIFIVSPQNKAKVFGNKLTVSFIVKNFTLKEPDPKNKNKPTEGYVKVRLISENSLEKTSNISKRTDFSIENIPQGAHTLTLELVQNDSTPLAPQTAASTNFTTIVDNKTTTLPTHSPTPTNENTKLPKQTIIFSSTAVTLALIFISTAILILLKNKK